MTQPSPQRMALVLLASAASLGAVSQAQAHAHLVSATPAPNSTVAPALKTVALQFNEPLMARFSGFTLSGANGAKLATSPVSLDPKSRKALSASVKAPLAAGAYKVTWHVVSADTHRMQGYYSFKVH